MLELDVGLFFDQIHIQNAYGHEMQFKDFSLSRPNQMVINTPNFEVGMYYLQV